MVSRIDMPHTTRSHDSLPPKPNGKQGLRRLLAAGARRFEQTDDYAEMYTRYLQAALLAASRRNARTEAHLRKLRAFNWRLRDCETLTPIVDGSRNRCKSSP